MGEIHINEKTENITYSSLSNLLLEIHTKSGINNSATGVTGDIIKESLNGGTVFVAMEENEPIGMVAVCKEVCHAWYHKGECGRIRYMGVLPEYQGSHIGSMLLEKALEWAYSQNIDIIRVSTSKENKKARALYAKHGCIWVNCSKVKGKNRLAITGVFTDTKLRYPRIIVDIRFAYSKCKSIISLLLRERDFNHKIRREQKIKQIIKKTPVFIYLQTGVRFVTHKYKLQIEKTIDKFLPEGEKTDSLYKTKLYRSVLLAVSENLIIPDEYFLYEFENKTKAERREFIGYNERRTMNLIINDDDIFARNLLSNKMNSYLKYGKYYGREIIEILGPEDEEKFNSFIDKNGKCMLKPTDKTRGEGILVISKENGSFSLKKIFEDNIQEGRFVLEQLVEQGEALKQYHPQSVNTVRLVSFLKDDNTVELLFAILRIGCGDMIVDNLGAGGIAAAVDLSNGEVITDGFTENGEHYTHHPDSGLKIKGEKLPEWAALLQIAKEAAIQTPEIQLIGWDFAWSVNGWIIIEANRSPSYTGIQMTTKRGIRSTFADKVGKPYV